MGGPRFRPCLEDIIEVAIDEFGLDHKPTHKRVLTQGRSRYRLDQLRTSVRNEPETAVTVLRELGYKVSESEPAIVTPKATSKSDEWLTQC